MASLAAASPMSASTMASSALSSSSSASSSSQAAAIAAPAPQPSASQLRAAFIEKCAAAKITQIQTILSTEIDTLAKLSCSGAELPEGTETYAFIDPKSPTGMIASYMRPKKIVADHVRSGLESDVKGLSDPQATLYNSVLSRTLEKMNESANRVTRVYLIFCEPEIKSGSKYDFAKSAILRSKIVALALGAPSNILSLFQ